MSMIDDETPKLVTYIKNYYNIHDQMMKEVSKFLNKKQNDIPELKFEDVFHFLKFVPEVAHPFFYPTKTSFDLYIHYEEDFFPDGILVPQIDLIFETNKLENSEFWKVYGRFKEFENYLKENTNYSYFKDNEIVDIGADTKLLGDS